MNIKKLALIFAVPSALFAVEPTASSPSKEDSKAEESASRQNIGRNAPASPEASRLLRKEALVAFREAREGEGEAKLTTLSLLQPQTPPWHFELSVNLLRTAFDARAVGDESAAQKAARRALKQIEKAEAGYSGNAARLSTLQDLRGVLAGEFLGTSEDAERHYREAARINPNSPAAKERIERIDRRRAEAADTSILN